MRSRVALGCWGLLLPLTIPTAATAAESHGRSPEVIESGHAAAAIGKAQAKKLAKAGVLTKADLKGYTSEAQPVDRAEAADERAFYKCVGVKAPSYLARNVGVSFTKGSLTIDSSADVASSVTVAKSDLKAIKSTKSPACFRKSILALLERSGATVKSVSVKRESATVKGADGVSLLHIKAVADFGGTPLKLDGYLLSVLVGQTEITVSPGRFDGKSPSLKQSTALAQIVIERVRAA